MTTDPQNRGRPVGTIAAAITREEAEDKSEVDLGAAISVYESDKPGWWHVGCGACGWHSYGLVKAHKDRLRTWGRIHKKACPAVGR